VSGRGGSNRRGSRRRDREGGCLDRTGRRNQDNDRHDRNQGVARLQWVPPPVPSEPIPSADCPYCGKPIKDIATAIGDKNSHIPVHFDCIIAEIAKCETLEKGDTLAYIGGGRFGIVCFSGHRNVQAFKIKKIIEWEGKKDERVDWRILIQEHYSTT
jgi:hypothetical protein